MTIRGIIAALVLLVFCCARPLMAKDAELSPTEGIQRYENLVQQYPKKASYHNALGYYYLKAENYQRAEACFLKTLELDSSHAIAHNNLGIVYLHTKRPEQAEKEFRQALNLNPSYCKAQYNLAVALFRQGRHKESLSAYLKAREMESDYVARRDKHGKTKENMQQALKEIGENDGSTRKLKRLKQWFAPYY